MLSSAITFQCTIKDLANSIFLEAPTGKCLHKKKKESNFLSPFFKCGPVEICSTLLSSKFLNYVASWSFLRALEERQPN
jgi:hypothetical protein